MQEAKAMNFIDFFLNPSLRREISRQPSEKVGIIFVELCTHRVKGTDPYCADGLPCNR